MDINHLSSDILNAKARTLVAAICARGNPVFHGRRSVAYEAARLGCANLTDVEVLEAMLAHLLRGRPVAEEPEGNFYSDRYGDW